MNKHKHNPAGDVCSSIKNTIKDLESTLESLSLIDSRVNISDLPSQTSSGIFKNPSFGKFCSFTKNLDNPDTPVSNNPTFGKFGSFTKNSDNSDTPGSNRSDIYQRMKVVLELVILSKSIEINVPFILD